MDDCVDSPSCKRTTLSEKQTKDRISNLPKEILHHIISFLSTREAVRTSILSTTLRRLWTSISTIILYGGDFWLVNDKHQHVIVGDTMEIVDKVLSLHDTSDIKKLELSFRSVHVDVSRLNLWIRAAVENNVQELTLYLIAKSQFQLPEWLFTCRSLHKLDLYIPSILKTPTKTTLSNLKKLCLSSITFSDEVSLQDFLCGCPVLDDLSLIDCEWRHVRSITISLPTIKTFTMQHIPPWKYMYTEQIKIKAVNLTSFNYTSDLNLNFKVCDLASLNSASVDFEHIIDDLHEVDERITDIIRAMYNIRTLSMTHDTLECIDTITQMKVIPIFYNLTQLELSTGLTEVTVTSLVRFLERTPNLEELSIRGLAEDTYIESLYLTKENVPSCFISSLKLFRFESFVGESADTELVSFVLMYAINLESAIMHCYSDFHKDDVEVWHKQLQDFPRTSRSCVIELIYYDW